MGGTQTNEEMNMIFNATDDFRNAAQTANCSAEIFVKFGAPGWFDEGVALLRGKYNVIMETQEC